MIFFPPLTLWLPEAGRLLRAQNAIADRRDLRMTQQQGHEASSANAGQARLSQDVACRGRRGRSGVGCGAPRIAHSRAKTLRFGHMLPTDQIHHKAIAMFADEIAKLSANKIKVEIFPSSQLGSIPEMLQSVQAGSLTMSMAVPAWYSSFMKPVDAFTLPYLVAQRRQAAAGARRRHRQRRSRSMGDAAGFKVLGYLPARRRGTSSTRCARSTSPRTARD